MRGKGSVRREDISNFLEPHRRYTAGVLEYSGCEGEDNTTEDETSNDERNGGRETGDSRDSI